MAPPPRSDRRKVRRGSMRRPRGSATKRRVTRSSSGRCRSAIRRLALAISSADICAKSFAFRTSRSETVRRAENSRLLDRLRLLLPLRGQGFGDAQRTSLRLLLLPCAARRDRRHLRDELFDQRAPPPEDPEGLVEQDAVLVPLHEHGMQRPDRSPRACRSAPPRRPRSRREPRQVRPEDLRPARPARNRRCCPQDALHPGGRIRRSLGCPQLALNPIEHLLGAAALHLLDVVLVFQQDAERVRDERRDRARPHRVRRGRRPSRGSRRRPAP